MTNLLANLGRSLLLATCVALAACSGNDGSSTTDESTTGTDGGSPDSNALACEQGQYACSWSAVSPSVVNRSVALGEQAAAKLKDGVSTTEIAAWLEQNEPLLEIQYDDSLMRIRLQGGRPVWIAKAKRLDPDAQPPVAPTASMTTPSRLLNAAGPAGGIVRPGIEQKRALILVPFRYEAGSAGDSRFSGGVQAAASLNNTRGYAGQVTLLENSSETSSDVTVDSFSTFRQYDVVFVQSHGGRLCFDLKTNQTIPCKAFVTAQAFNGTPLDLLNSTTTGVELLILDNTHKTLILSNDYFRSQYPGGLLNTLVYISSCSSYETSLAKSLEGAGSNFMGWNDPVSNLTSSALAPMLFDGLATGRTLQAVYADLSIENETHDGYSGADLLIGQQKLRIRELLTVRDEATGQPLATGQAIHINGNPEDGSPDTISLVIDVDGIEDGEADKFVLHLEIDGKPFNPMVVGAAGAQAGPYSWRVHSVAPLGFDVTSGQVLKIHAWVELPEGGQSSVVVSPEITQVGVGLGSVYQGTSTRVWKLNAGPTITAKANVTFRLEGSLSQPQARYNVVEGTMTVTFSDNPGTSICGYSGSVVVPMPVNVLNRITVDTKTMKYSGYGQSAGPAVAVVETCPGQAPQIVSFNSSSIWFVANEGDAFHTDGSAIEGNYESSSTSRFNWSFVKVE